MHLTSPKNGGIPFTIAFAYTLDESNYMADVLLPDATDLESTQLIKMGGTSYMEQFWRHGYGLRQPVVSPPGEAKDFSEIAQELAKRTGLLESYNKMINKGMAGVKLKRKSTTFPSMKAASIASMKFGTMCVVRQAPSSLTANIPTGLPGTRSMASGFRKYSQLNWYLYPRMRELNLRFELPYQRYLRSLASSSGTGCTRKTSIGGMNSSRDASCSRSGKVPAIWEQGIIRSGRSPDDFPFWLVTANSMQFAWGSI